MVKAKYESFQVFNNSEILNSINKNSNWSKRDDKLNKILRKNAHVFEYLVLSIVVSTLLFSLNLKGKSAIIYIMFICLFYAVTDEFHQQFIPGRSALISDVLIDFGGSIIGILIFYLFYYTAYKKLKTKT